MSWTYRCMTCGKTSIGPQIPGGMLCNCTPPKKIQGTFVETPLSDELTKEMSSGEVWNKRVQLCSSWGIENKAHKPHGSNMNCNQTLQQLIHNIVSAISELREYNRVRLLIIAQYSYDISSRRMVD